MDCYKEYGELNDVYKAWDISIIILHEAFMLGQVIYKKITGKFEI